MATVRVVSLCGTLSESLCGQQAVRRIRRRGGELRRCPSNNRSLMKRSLMKNRTLKRGRGPMVNRHLVEIADSGNAMDGHR